ncbi:MAG: hypothetical protein H6832_06210 [Planctomycetes bacterium]|nr:hypothetical protein [Planctomycetota bacterium]MCB9917979.1 hypothetical protein [Planctomycetota bacterium]
MKSNRRSLLALALVVAVAYATSSFVKAKFFDVRSDAATATHHRGEIPKQATGKDNEVKEAWERDLHDLSMAVRCAAKPDAAATGTRDTEGLTLPPPAVTFLSVYAKIARELGLILPQHPLLPPTTWAELVEASRAIERQIAEQVVASTKVRNELYEAKVAAHDYDDVAAPALQAERAPNTSIASIRGDDGTHLFRVWRWTFEEAPRLWFDEFAARALRLEHLLCYVRALRANDNVVTSAHR